MNTFVNYTADTGFTVNGFRRPDTVSCGDDLAAFLEDAAAGRPVVLDGLDTESVRNAINDGEFLASVAVDTDELQELVEALEFALSEA